MGYVPLNNWACTLPLCRIECNRTASRPCFTVCQSLSRKQVNPCYNSPFPFFHSVFSPLFFVTSVTLFQLVWNCCILKCLDSLSVRSGLAQPTAPGTWGKWKGRCYLKALHSSTVPVQDWKGRWRESFTHKHILTCATWNNCHYLRYYPSNLYFTIKSGWNSQQVWKLQERTRVHTVAM